MKSRIKLVFSNRKTTSSTNLWSANLNEVSKETDLSRASWFYSHDQQQFVEYGKEEGQSITFKVDPVGAYYYVGLKCPDGSADGKVKFSNGNVKVQSTDIDHSTDLYYAVVPDEYGYITIANSGEALLSVTKLRIAGPAASGQVLTLSEEEALEAVQLFSMRSVEEDVTDPDDSGSDNTGSSNTENNTKPPVKVPADPENPETADGSISVMIWVMCGALIMAAYLMVSRVRRCDYEA